MSSNRSIRIELLACALLCACSAAPSAPTAPPSFTKEAAAADPVEPQSGASTISRAGTRPAEPQAPETQPQAAGAYMFALQPYFWLVGAEGHADIGSGAGQVHASFGGVFDSMDAAYGLRFETGPVAGPYRILFDMNYESMSQDTRLGSFHSYHSMFEGDFAWRLDDKGYLQPLLGVRYTEVDTVTTFPSSAVSTSRGWFDPIVGARSVIPVADQFALTLRGDVGGFGVGSDFTAQLDAAASFQFSKKFSGQVGWRYVKVDYSSSDLDYDVAITGPYAAITFVF